eukprot:2177765-Amphidinium_carterae.2
MKQTSAAGPGGWHQRELAALPHGAYVELVGLMNTCLRLGKVPLEWCLAIDTYIPKQKGNRSLSKQRPISVLSSLWRLMARILAKRVQSRAEAFFLDSQYGARKARSVREPIMSVLTNRDLRKCKNARYCAMQLDIKKCFNNMHVGHALEIMKRIGMPTELINIMAFQAEHLVHQNKLMKMRTGPAWRPLRGLPQGCPLSVMCANLIMRWVTDVQPYGTARIHSYLDDVIVEAYTQHDLQVTLDRLMTRYELAALEVCQDKCIYVAVDSRDAVFHWRGVAYEAAATTELLGMDVRMLDNPAAGDRRVARWEEARQRLRRISWIPGSFRFRAMLISAMVCPLISYGALLDKFTEQNLRALAELTVVAANGAQAKRPPEMSKEILFHALLKGHRLDPKCNILYTCLALLRRFFAVDPDVAKFMLDSKLKDIAGTFRETLDAAAALCGMEIDGNLLRSNGHALKILDGRPDDEWLHLLRHALRTVQIDAVAVRRPREFGHLRGNAPHPVVRKVIAAESNMTKLTVQKLWTTGGFITLGRQSRHNRVTDASPMINPICRHCQSAVEDVTHILRDCPHWCGSLRLALAESFDDIPESVYETGLVSHDLIQQRVNGEELYRKWFQQASGVLLARNIAHEKTPEVEWPALKRLRVKAAPPLAYHARAVASTRVAKNVQPKTALELPGHIQQRDDGALTCMMCGRARKDRLAAFLRDHRECDGMAFAAPALHRIQNAPEHIQIAEDDEKYVCCHVCSARAPKALSKKFVEAHVNCVKSDISSIVADLPHLVAERGCRIQCTLCACGAKSHLERFAMNHRDCGALTHIAVVDGCMTCSGCGASSRTHFMRFRRTHAACQ